MGHVGILAGRRLGRGVRGPTRTAVGSGTIGADRGRPFRPSENAVRHTPQARFGNHEESPA